MYTFEFVPIPGAVDRDSSGSSQVQFSPSGNFVHYTTAGRGFFGRWNGSTYVPVTIPTSPSGTYRSTDWPDDEAYVLSIVNESRVELRTFNKTTGLWGNSASSFVALACRFLVHLTGNYFAAIHSTASGSRFAVLRVNGLTLEIVSNTSYATSRIWAFASKGNDVYLLTGSDHRIEHVSVTNGVATIVDTLQTGSVANYISLSQDGSKFHLASDDPAQCRIGFTQPLSMVTQSWTGKTGNYSAWLFDDGILQVFSPQKYMHVSSDLTSVELANDVEMISVGNGEVIGTSKNFSRYGDRVAWVKSIPSSTDSPFFVVIEAQSSTESNILAAGIMADPYFISSVNRFTDFAAVSPMADALVTFRQKEATDLFAVAPKGDAFFKVLNLASNINAVGIMAEPFFVTDNTKRTDLLAVAPKGDAWTYIRKPGVCKSR